MRGFTNLIYLRFKTSLIATRANNHTTQTAYKYGETCFMLTPAAERSFFQYDNEQTV